MADAAKLIVGFWFPGAVFLKMMNRKEAIPGTVTMTTIL